MQVDFTSKELAVLYHLVQHQITEHKSCVEDQVDVMNEADTIDERNKVFHQMLGMATTIGILRSLELRIESHLPEEVIDKMNHVELEKRIQEIQEKES